MAARRIEFRPHTEDEKETIVTSIKQHTKDVGGVVTDSIPNSVFIYEDDQLIASVVGYVFWNWFFADLVWVAETHRRKGLGTEVMSIAEDKAKEMKLTGLYLWTESWQATGFYEKLGYKPFVEFNDFPPGHKRYGFRRYF